MRAEAAGERKDSTLHSTAWELGAQITVLICGLLIMGTLARSLGPAGYGQYAVLITVLCWIEYGLGAFFSRATIKAIAEADEWQPVARTALRGGLVLSVMFAVGFAIAAWPIALVLGMPELAWIMALMAIDIPIFLRGQLYLQIFAGRRSFRGRAIATAGRALSRVVLILIVVELGGGVPEATLTWLGASIVELVIARSLSGLRVHGPRVPTRALAVASIPLFVAAVCLKFTDGLDLIIVKSVTTSELAGLYAGATNLALVPAFLGMALMPVILSSVSDRRKREGRASAGRAGAAWLRLGFLALPAAAIGAALSPEITQLVLGAGFAQSAEFFPYLLAACAGRVWLALATAFLAGLDLATIAAKFAVAYLIASPLGVFGGLFLGGVVGAAAGYAIVAWIGVVGLLVVLIASRAAVIPWNSALRSLAAVGCVLVLGSYLPEASHLVTIFFKGFLLLLVASGVLALLGEFTTGDLQVFRAMRGAVGGSTLVRGAIK